MKRAKLYPFDPAHPPPVGEVLREHMLERKITRKQVAFAMGISVFKIHHLILGEAKITADEALGLERLFGEPAEYWMAIEMAYRLHVARKAARR